MPTTRAKLQEKIRVHLAQNENPLYPTTRMRKRTIREDILNGYFVQIIRADEIPRDERRSISRGLAVRKVKFYPP